MNKTEVAQLLTIAGGFDRFINVDAINVNAWHLLLENTKYDEAQEAVVEFFRTWDGRGQITVAFILGATGSGDRKTADQIAADVRSAKARGLIDRDWSQKEPLPDDVQTQLDTIRDEYREWLRINPWALNA